MAEWPKQTPRGPLQTPQDAPVARQGQRITRQLSSVSTEESRPLPALNTPPRSATSPLTTRPLGTMSSQSGHATFKAGTRPLTYIPGTPRVVKTTPLPPVPTPRSRSRKFVISMVSMLIILLLTVVVTTPLGNSNAPLLQGIGNLLLSDAQNPFSPAQHIATPTATPALTTLEGSCNAPYMGLWGICATAVTDSGVMGTGDMQPPMKGERITQGFGLPEYQTWCSCVKPHTGIDLATAYGNPVMASDSGQVIWVGWDWSGLGNAVKINHGRYIATVYGHLASYIVHVGQNVNKGDVVAYEGSTGASSGPHVHFMVVDNNHFKDPTLYMTLP